MLRIETKDNFIRILKDVQQLCQKGLELDNSVLLTILQESQEAIIVLGNCIEREVADAAPIIAEMELLCENFYLWAENMDKRDSYGAVIIGQLQKLLREVEELPTAYQIVFFPYKADMWDSLESIWLACKEDSRCDCKVVPIPYYRYDATKDEWNYTYEIEKFPEYVDVVDYRDYDLEECADAAFIHNPYDEYNYVTHVHSDYYSYNLKKHVKKLFYVPYYVTSGFISESQKQLSAYMHADYIIVQSETFKEGLKGYPYYDKVVVLGSPKLDRVIRLSKDKGHAPESWKSIIGEKKSVMLNTSLNQFLADSEAYLRKLAYIFDVVKAREDVVLIWRPHPLLKSTIESMRPHLLETYENLQRYFIAEQIGIFDTTPDIIHTVAIADAYIGEASSSVINLFQAAGKPLFILNNYITEPFSEEEKRRMLFLDCEKVGDKYYAIAAESSGIYIIEDSDWSNVRKVASFENGPKWVPNARRSVLLEDKIYFASTYTEVFYAYDIEKNQVEQLSVIDDDNMQDCRGVISYKEKIFYLLRARKCIMEYNTIHKTWKKHVEPILALQKGIQGQIYEDIFGYCQSGQYIWMTNLYSNRVLRFDMKNGQYKIYELGEPSMRYSAIAVQGNMLYLSDADNGTISVWDIEKEAQVRCYLMPPEYHTFKNVQGRGMSQNRLLLVGDYLIATPFTANAVVRVDLRTHKVELLAEDFWTDVLQSHSYYSPQAHGVSALVKVVGKHRLLIQRRSDAAILDIDIHTGTYEIYIPSVPVEEYEYLLSGEDGFEKIYTNAEFSCRESKYFSVGSFFENLICKRFDEVMLHQKESMKTMAVHLDGSTGESVHSFMMNELDKFITKRNGTSN